MQVVICSPECSLHYKWTLERMLLMGRQRRLQPLSGSVETRLQWTEQEHVICQVVPNTSNGSCNAELVLPVDEHKISQHSTVNLSSVLDKFLLHFLYKKLVVS